MDNFSVKPIFTTTEKIERVANLEIKKEVDIYANDNSFPTTNAIKKYVDNKTKVDSSYNPESTDALNGKAVSSALANYLPLDAELQLELDGGDAGGELDIEYIIDDELSDTSTNPVQNKAIKKYIDNVNNRVDELNEKLIDFIVEEGTLGIWSYRKWNSGIAECWGQYEHNFESFNSTAYDLIFFSYVEGIDLPFTFKPIQSVIASVKLQPYVGTVEAQVPTSDESTTVSLLFTQFGNSNTTETYKFFIEIKGRWK